MSLGAVAIATRSWPDTSEQPRPSSRGILDLLVFDAGSLEPQHPPVGRVAGPPYPVGMCRNITELRGLEPAATEEEIEAAARQFVRKVSGVHALNDNTRDPFEAAVAEVAASTTRLLASLPARRQPPVKVPPLRRPSVRERMAAG